MQPWMGKKSKDSSLAVPYYSLLLSDSRRLMQTGNSQRNKKRLLVGTASRCPAKLSSPHVNTGPQAARRFRDLNFPPGHSLLAVAHVAPDNFITTGFDIARCLTEMDIARPLPFWNCQGLFSGQDSTRWPLKACVQTCRLDRTEQPAAAGFLKVPTPTPSLCRQLRHPF